MAFEFITQPIYGALNYALLPIINAVGPMLGIFLIAAIVTLLVTIANKYLVDQDRLQFLQKEMKGFQKEMMEAQKSNDPKALAEVQKKQSEFMKLQQEMMLNSFKPMIVTIVPIFLIFGWMWQVSSIYHLVVELPSFIYYVLLVPLWHAIPFYNTGIPIPEGSIGWLGWYILCSFSMSFTFRKFLGLKGAM